jgi:hypothetical protein
MRDLLSKVLTGSMIAGAALLVSACGGSEDATANNAEVNVEDSLMPANDITDVDAMNATDATGVDANATANTTTNTTTTDTTTTTTNTTETNGM